MRQKKVLINAYACSPNMGSEPGMAWNWCINLANYCELHVITEGEFKVDIEKALIDLPQAKNLYFYYVPVTDSVRRMCWNQGDWRFYSHYKDWQSRAYETAIGIMKNIPIDIIHQLNMIGFQEPGYLWRIKDVPFVWGPIGGLKKFPTRYLIGSGLKEQIFYRLKNYIVIFLLKYNRRIVNALNRADILVSSIPDSYNAIKKYQHLESVIINETGCFMKETVSGERFESNTLTILWVGKFDYRKQLLLALRSLAASYNDKIVLEVYGKGTLQQEDEAKKLITSLKIEKQVVFHGNQPNEVIMKAMSEAQLFFFTSVSEDTSTVVLEAISNRLPVLCFDACGYGTVVDERVGRKIALTSPEQSIREFAQQLNYLAEHRNVLKEMSNNCEKRQHELSWEVKAQQMMKLYKEISL